MRKVLFLVCFILSFVAIRVNAQTIINPTAFEFIPSANHSDTKLDGTAVVMSYEFSGVGMAGSGALAITVNFGKPTPVNNLITVLFSSNSLFSIFTKNIVYTAKISAIGPDGIGASDPSNPFGFSAPMVPIKPANVKVK